MKQIIIFSLFSPPPPPLVSLMFLLRFRMKLKIFHHQQLFLSLVAKDLTLRRGGYLTPVKPSQPKWHQYNNVGILHFDSILLAAETKFHQLHLLFFIGT